MRAIAILSALLLSLPGLAAAQSPSPQAPANLAVAERGGGEWQDFVSQQDGISVNFPSQPTITETTWTSQLRYTLPARVFSVEKGPERYSMTVVDYRPLEQQGYERWKQCPPGNSQCRNGGETIGPGYWKQDERGAMTFALSKYMKDEKYTITDYAWDWQDMVEGYHLQLDGPGDRRTLVYVAMHQRKLYILEASSPAHYPEPGLFQQSIGWLDENGKRIRYTETIYSNSYHGLGVYPKPSYRISGE